MDKLINTQNINTNYLIIIWTSSETINKLRNLLIIFIVLIIYSCGPYDTGRELAYKQNLSGVVTSKYLVKWDHNTACISTNKINEIAIDRWCHNNDLWERIQIDDSIYKPSGTLDFWLIKPNGDKFLYKHNN